MDYTISEVLQFVEENDVKYVRLVFCDLFGRQKNICIMAEELPRAFNQGISFDASAVDGFMNVEASDLFLYPDAGTLAILPWRPQQGRVLRFYCDIRYPNGDRFEGDCRSILKQTILKAQERGYRCQIGAECEFYLFKLDEKGEPTRIPYDEAGYCDLAPLDKGENIRREICVTLAEMGIRPESSHHEQGPGQNEVDFKYSDALAAADHLMTFKSAVKMIGMQNGLYASFMPKPLEDKSGNGLHINLSLVKNGENIFKEGSHEHSSDAESFIQGILERIREITVFLNPTVNSYARLGVCEAPSVVSWSHQNRSQLIRIPAAKGQYIRMELRSPDCACNPYMAFALLIEAGLEGMEKKKILCEPSNFNVYQATETQLQGLLKLPNTLEEAIELAKVSTFAKHVLPPSSLDKYIEAKQKEWKEYQQASDQALFEKNRYFDLL